MSFKILMAGRRKHGQTLAEHRHHMKNVHGQLVLDYIAAEPEKAPRRYVQNHVFDGIFPGGEGQSEPFALGLDFVTEIWAPDLASLKAGRETDYYRTHLFPDEANMVDPEQVVGIPVHEDIIRAPQHETPGRAKVFLFWHGASPSITALMEALGEGAGALVGQSRCRPAIPSALQAIDVFLLADEPAALALAQHCRDAIRQNLAVEHGNISIAIAREYVLNAG